MDVFVSRLSIMLSTYEKNYGRRYHYPMILFHTDLTDTDKIKIRSMAPSLSIWSSGACTSKSLIG